MLVVKVPSAPPCTATMRSAVAFGPPMLPRRHTILLVLALAAPTALPADRARLPAPARRLRGPARAARRLHPRPHARRDPRLRRHRHPPARLLAQLRPAAERQAQAGRPLRGLRPGDLPRRHLGAARRADPRRVGARDQGAPQPHRTRPALGHQEPQGQRHAAEPEGVPGVGDGGRPPLRRRGRDLVDLERAQPAAVPQAAVPQRQALLARPLPARSTRSACAASRRRPPTAATRT